jgi:hypothetical protein
MEKCLELQGKMDQNSKPEVPVYDRDKVWFVVPDDLFDSLGIFSRFQDAW